MDDTRHVPPRAPLPWPKRVVLFGVAALAVVGVYVTVANLPVVSGCGLHADCPSPVGQGLPEPPERSTSRGAEAPT